MTFSFVSMKVKNELVGNLRNFRRNMMNIRVLLILLLLPAAAFLLPGAADSSSGQSLVEWEILSKLNYSSQIRLHPHLLLLVTVPWSGESRSFMKELADVVAHDQGRFGSLKLMVLYRSSERMLADAVGADEGITIFYYHHSHPHKYLGRLRVQNILSSLHYVMSLLPEQLPFKILKTPEDLEIFLGSTDKALILSEFCGWTQKLLAKGGNNNSERGFGFHEQFNGTIAAKENENQGLENANMDCGVDNRFTEMPWLSEFTSANNSAFVAAENMSLNSGASCKIDEFQHFESFLPKFLTVARDLFLPPERLRFGLVLDKALLSSLNIKDSGSWLVTLHFAGCPSCLKVLREGDDLKAFAKIQAWPVAELEDDVDDLENALLANKPSVVLFIDRSSDSLRIREKSRKALDSFREFALKIQMSNEMSEPKAFRSQKTSLKAFQASRSTSKHPKVGLLSASQKINIKDKMSIVVLNQGKQVILEDLVSGLQGSTLHEVLAYALQQKKEVKLSSLAKDAGFQLLSEDFDIKTVQALPGQTEVQSNKALELLVEDVSEGIIDPDKKAKLHEDAIFGKQYNEQSESNKAKPSHVSQKDAETVLVHTDVQSDELGPLEGALVGPIDSGKDQMPHVEEGKHIEQMKPVNTELQNDENNLLEDESSQKSVNFGHDGMMEVANSPSAEETVEKLDEQNEKRNFRSSFFFLDGHYRRLRTLTSGSNIPSVVLIDPTSQQHYVLSGQTDFSCTLLSEFLDGFLNGSLHPYQQSEHVVPTIRDAPIPPFVNLDFHEADSIPRVTVHMFNELVFYNQSDSKNAGNSRDRDVLVLFSNSWCGFCQRMELVVREVYRAIKGYTKTLRNGFKNEKLSLNRDEASNANLKFPLIYLMDCTLNDCSPILKSAVQRELYPSLLLFPAGRKKAIPYGGDIVVSNIIDFLAHHGGHFYDLLQEKGILWSEGEPGINHNMNAEAPPFKNLLHEIILQEGPPTLDVQFSKNRAPLSSSAKTSPHVIVGSILVATEKLLNVHPFDGSKVLVVKVNQSTGFQGLIVNKHISWDTLDELEDNLQLLKEAPLSFGGPVMKRGMPLVSLSRKYIVNQSMEVLPNVYFLDHRATISIIEELRLGNQSIYDFWFFLGFSSWGWDQLFDEISEGAWIVRNHDEEQIDGAWR
ncbi:PREDICTED: uncharacterized protein LOC109240038 [Nicotiana attenuata]|uniref:uncharacterized protein LOC109240038 n=1 Tax=Nicotiana attenuata TaxID=49451 RepID=UPI000904A0C2|nr:PREDICTED: uncharacterized protein LOC109240038 [Nicotiana attenuata]